MTAVRFCTMLFIPMVAVGLSACTSSIPPIFEVDESEVYSAAFNATIADALSHDQFVDRPYCLSIKNDSTVQRFHALSAETIGRVAVDGAEIINADECQIEFTSTSAIQKVTTQNGAAAFLVYASHLSTQDGRRYDIDLAIIKGPKSAVGYHCTLKVDEGAWIVADVSRTWRA